MANTHPCPACDELVDADASLCPHCGADLSGAVLTLQENPLAQQTEPIPALPASQAPLGIHVTVNNDSTPLPPPTKPHLSQRSSSPWWIVAFVALGVILILGSIFLIAHQPTPTVTARPTPTTAPSPTATPIPQAHVVIQLDNATCLTTRDFLHSDSFYIKSSFRAQGVDGKPITMTKTTNHYNLSSNETANFNEADRVVFDANIPLGGEVKGSLTAYSDNDTDVLGTTDIRVSAGDSTHTVSWHITGRSSLINTWEYNAHFTIAVTRVAAASPAGATVRGTAPSLVGQALDVSAARRWGA